MINLIYLVLTAILALNVSGEVLDAFKTVNDGIGNSNTSLKTKNSDIYTDFTHQFANDSARADKAYKKALLARQLSDKLYVLLEQYKKQMITEAGGIDPATGKIKRDDDINVSTEIFVENDGKKGKELKQEIELTRKELLDLLDGADRKDAEQSFALKMDTVEPGKTWEYAKFNSVPVVAAVTLLTKYQNDLLSAEGHVVEKLYSSVYAKLDKVDRFAAKVNSPGNYVLQGEAYKADVMVAAYNSTQNPEAFLGQFTGDIKRGPDGQFQMIESRSDALPLLNPVKVNVDGGIAKLNMAGSAIGNRKYTGVMRVKNTDGVYKFFPFEGEYQVAQKTAVVSPKMMNVLYIGLDNPLDISVPGVAQSDINASFNGNGTIIKGTDGTYAANVTVPGPTKVVVKAKINGRELVMGEQTFRVKRVPDPVTTVDGVYEGGKIRKGKISSGRGCVALVKNFEYVTKFTVLSFDFIYRSKKDGNNIPVSNIGPGFNDHIKEILTKRVQAGDAIFLDEIIVKGPGGDKRKINPIAFDVVP